jgi:hypothetical protein
VNNTDIGVDQEYLSAVAALQAAEAAHAAIERSDEEENILNSLPNRESYICSICIEVANQACTVVGIDHCEAVFCQTCITVYTCQKRVDDLNNAIMHGLNIVENNGLTNCPNCRGIGKIQPARKARELIEFWKEQHVCISNIN